MNEQVQLPASRAPRHYITVHPVAYINLTEVSERFGEKRAALLRVHLDMAETNGAAGQCTFESFEATFKDDLNMPLGDADFLQLIADQLEIVRATGDIIWCN